MSLAFENGPVGKQVASINKSPLVDGDIQDSFKRNVIGQCPVIGVKFLDLNIQCLVDTGSMVSTITESFYWKNIEPLGTTLKSTSMLQLKAANGLEIPYI